MIVALDPGKTTGAAYHYDKVNQYSAEQFSDEYVWRFLTMCRRAGMHTLVVEKFKQRPHLQSVDLSPVETIGVVKEWARQDGTVQVEWQDSANAKFFFTDAVLRKMRVYQPASPHAMDALRHLLTYLNRHNEAAIAIRARTITGGRAQPDN